VTEPAKSDLERGAEAAADFPSRLVETSAGWVILKPSLAPGVRGGAVDMNVFGPDGWAIYNGAWLGLDGGEPLSAKLARVCRIPPEEAEGIADQILEEWRSRGYEGRARRVKRAVSLFTLAVGLVVLLALLGVALGVWELVQLLNQ
jgi:hypothetical protein